MSAWVGEEDWVEKRKMLEQRRNEGFRDLRLGERDTLSRRRTKKCKALKERKEPRKVGLPDKTHLGEK